MGDWLKSNTRELRDYARAFVLLGAISTLIEFLHLGVWERVAPHLYVADYVALGFIGLAFLSAPLILLPVDSRSSGTALRSIASLYVLFGIGFTLAILTWMKNGTTGAILLSAVLVTLGWVIAQRNGKRSARKQHTINVLLQQRNSEMLQFHSINITSYLPFNQSLSPSGLAILEQRRNQWAPSHTSDKTGYPVLASIAWVLNYYEFISLGIASGDLNDRLMKRSIRGMLCHSYLRYYPCIAQSFDRPISGPYPFENLKIIFDEWATPAETKRLQERQAEWRAANPLINGSAISS